MDLSNLFNSGIDTGVSGSTPAIIQPKTPTIKALIPTQPKKYVIKNRGVEIDQRDIDSLRPIVYGEVSNRTPDKQQLEAHVITNTAINRMVENSRRGNSKKMSDILAEPNAYQAYNGPQYARYSNPILPMDIAKKKQVDAIIDNIVKQMESGHYEDNTNGAYYYRHNPDGTITYDDKKPLFKK